MTLNDLRAPWPKTSAIAVAIVVGVYAAWIASGASAVSSSFRPDVDQLWFSARAVIDGRNPYDLVGPGKEFDYDWPLLYPMPAVVLSLVLAPFTVESARIIMASLPSAVLAYAIARSDPGGLVLFLSRAFYANAWYAQWTPLLMLVWWFPALAFLAVCKPTSGVAMLAGPVQVPRGLAVAIAIAAALLVVSFVLQPGWLHDWLSAVRSVDHVRPWVTLPLGWLLFLAALRWRSWRARFLLAFAIVPQTPHDLAVLPFILVPQNFLLKVTVAALTFLPSFLLTREPFGSLLVNASTHADRFAIRGELVLWTVLLPALLMVLLERRQVDDALPGLGADAHPHNERQPV